MAIPVARHHELARLSAFVVPGDPFTAGALVIEGPAGIGKSTLWAAALTRAAEAGHTVLRCAPVERERQLSFAAVGDLLRPLLTTAIADLPAPQRRALRVALLLEPPSGEAPGIRAIATGVVGAITAAAATAPVVVAIDDEAALDDASRAVLGFALRRLDAAAVRILVSRRGEDDRTPLGLPDETERLTVDPLDVAGVHDVLANRLGRSFPRPVVQRLQEASEGNPLYALELGRVLLDRRLDLGPDDPLPVTDSIGKLLEARFASLAAPTRALVELVATVLDPRTGLVTALAAEDGMAGEVDRALAAGVLREEGGRLQIAHPLLAAAVYAQIGPERRQTLHMRLADGGEPGDEARALHLGNAALAPDPGVARELAGAATRARAPRRDRDGGADDGGGDAPGS